MSDHSVFPPSSAYIWTECPVSIILSEGLREDNVYTIEGSIAHDIAAKCLKNDHHPSIYLNEPEILQKYDEESRSEMEESILKYKDYVYRRLKNGTLMFVEQRIKFDNLASKGFGTVDCALLHEDSIDIIDLKYGKGVRVDVYDNLQFALYIIGFVWSIVINKCKNLDSVEASLACISGSEITFHNINYRIHLNLMRVYS